MNNGISPQNMDGIAGLKCTFERAETGMQGLTGVCLYSDDMSYSVQSYLQSFRRAKPTMHFTGHLYGHAPSLASGLLPSRPI